MVLKNCHLAGGHGNFDYTFCRVRHHSGAAIRWPYKAQTYTAHDSTAVEAGRT